ncbi:Transcription factor [Arachis hypogaea]|nr:Transcription factor [Arachis hypogaea]
MLLENFKEQLALSVRSIQWSYAIFWSTSSTQPGVLSWGEGYYNGDIKTRKTSQGVELNSDQIGLQRSEQLRELYKSLKAVEASPQTKGVQQHCLRRISQIQNGTIWFACPLYSTLAKGNDSDTNKSSLYMFLLCLVCFVSF